jgi:flagellar operon protein
MELNTMYPAGHPMMTNQVAPAQTGRIAAPAPASAPKGVSFTDVLRKKVDGLRFSAHAETRMASRNITLTPELMGKLEKAVSGAATKGARDSLIIMKNCAFIVNIPNRTVVTAMDGENLKENIFTNIDSAVLAD